MDLYIVDESQYSAWRSASTTREYDDPKGWEGVNYLTPSAFFESLPKDVSKVTTSPKEAIGRVIERVTGEYPRLYEDAEIRTAIGHGGQTSRLRGSESDEVVSEALRLARSTASYSLVSLERRIGRYGLRDFANAKSLDATGIVDGQLLTLRRRSAQDICSMAASIVWERSIRPCSPCMMMIRDADDFNSQVIGVQDSCNVIESLQSHGHDSWSRSRRTRMVLLYTEEDPEIATYVRCHFDALDKLSGRNFDVFVIEKPSAVHGYAFWRSILPETLYVIWAMAGFVGARPYDKSECYRIAESLGVAPSRLPCAVELPTAGGMAVKSITPLRGSLTRVFRELFSTNAPPATDTDPEVSSHHPSTLCFMSHNSQDKSVVREVAAILHAEGIECWLDEWEILPGDNITREISAGIEKATHLAFFMSQANVRSNWVDEEINASLYRAISSRKQKIIPVMLEPCHPPALIAGNAHISMGKDSPRIAEELIRAIQRKANKPLVEVRSV